MHHYDKTRTRKIICSIFCTFPLLNALPEITYTEACFPTHEKLFLDSTCKGLEPAIKLINEVLVSARLINHGIDPFTNWSIDDQLTNYQLINCSFDNWFCCQHLLRRQNLYRINIEYIWIIYIDCPLAAQFSLIFFIFQLSSEWGTFTLTAKTYFKKAQINHTIQYQMPSNGKGSNLTKCRQMANVQI